MVHSLLRTGHGIITDGIDVSVIGATVDGDVAGTGMLIQNSQLAYLYPMDATGNVGVEVVDSSYNGMLVTLMLIQF